MTETIKISLRYWNCRGRAQAVRYMLEEIAAKNKNVIYEENFEVLETMMESWPQRKPDENISGPFHNLPVLHWNEKDVFGQTLSIGQFLARKFQLYGKATSSITDSDVLAGYIDGVVSCAYTDVISNILLCIWSLLDFKDDKSPVSRAIVKVRTDLKALNDLLSKSSTPFFYDQPEPTIADFFVFEAYTLSRDYHEKMIPDQADRQALIQLEQVMRERASLAAYFQRGGLIERFTGSPTEKDYIKKLRAGDE